MIAAITSCTNTSNPSVLVAAGLVARKARAKGLDRKPWVKTSLAPGSKVVTDYLDASGPQRGPERARLRPRRLWLHDLHRQFGAAAPSRSRKAIADKDLVAAQRAVGQPQFRGPRVARLPRQLSRLAAAGGRLCAEGHGPRATWSTSRSAPRRNGEPVFLKDIWPTNEEVRAADRRARPFATCSGRATPTSTPATSAGGRSRSPAARPTAGRPTSTYIQNPPYFTGMTMTPVPPKDIAGARALAVFGDSITTDHISPAGAIKPDSPAGRYLQRAQVGRGPSSTATARGAATIK